VRQKSLVFLAVALTYALQLTVFVGIRPELAYTLHHRLPDRALLPFLTSAFALPVLGPGGLEGSPTAIFYFFWALVLLPPAVLAWRTWIDATVTATMERFVYCGSSYALTVALGYTLVLFGLWLPYSAA
jgi:hypothetical protein